MVTAAGTANARTALSFALLQLALAIGWPISASASSRAQEMAAIFGDNNLDDAANAEGEFDRAVPNNCVLYEKLGRKTPSTGRIGKIGKDGNKVYLGTGETIIRDDIVISAAHLVSQGDATPLSPGDRLFFEVLEPSGGSCSFISYAVGSFETFTDDPRVPRCTHLDVALFRLNGHVSDYRPLELASPELVEEFRSGRRTAVKIGFPNHASVSYGRQWSIVTARAFRLERHDPSCRNDFLFAHDGDAWSGESGAVFRIDGKLVGVHIRGYDEEQTHYINSRANIGALLGPQLRQGIIDYVNLNAATESPPSE